MNPTPRPSLAAAVGGFVVLALAAGPWLVPAPPEPLGPEAPDDLFSADRAWRWVDRLAVAPRPMGSPGHAAARELLVARLTQLGLDVRVDERVVLNETFKRWKGPVTAVRARNVVGRLAGTSPGGAILLAAHYDSHPTTPGAADDAMGVAAILETLRALKAGPPLKHDVLVLFSDAEEVGLLGARAFARSSPDRAGIKAFLNFEARGNAAQVTMFRATSPDAALVRVLDEHVPSAFSTSFAAAVARLLPNDTDFTEFAAGGLSGMDFANTGGWARYHATTDTAANLDRGTLQHHGEYALGLTRALASLPSLDVLSEPGDASWFLWGRVRLRHPRGLELPFAVAAFLLALAAAFGLGDRARKLDALAGLVKAPALVAVTAFVAYVVAKILKGLHPEYALVPSLATGVVSAHLAGFALQGVSSVALAGRGRVLRSGLGGEPAGVAVVWSAIALGLAVAVPGASLVFLVPAVALSLASLAGLGDEEWGRFAQFLAAVVTVVLWRPIGAALADTFGLGLPVAIAAVAALVATAAMGPLGALASRRGLATALNTLPLVAFVVGHFSASFDAQHPRPVHLSYAWDADHAAGHVVSAETLADPWLDAHVDAPAPVPAWRAIDAPFAVAEPRQRPASAPALPPPALEVVSDTHADGTRTLVLRVTPPPGSGTTVVASEALPVRSSVDGLPLPEGVPNVAPLLWFGDGPFVLSLATTETRPMRLVATSRTPGFPSGLAVTPRPADRMPTPANALPPRDPLRWSDAGVVTVTGTF